MILTGKAIERRALLRGAGAAIALPWLDAMSPAFAATDKSARAPTRLLFVYIPIGAEMESWTPVGEGRDFEFSRTLKPLEPFRRDLSVLTGLDSYNANALGDGAGGHARAGAAYLTGVHPKKTSGTDIRCGISADQVAAQSVGRQTKFASLELGCEDSRIVGACDSGYSCAYQNSISWASETMPLPPETNPRTIFERLFGSDDLGLPPARRQQRIASRRSILDFVAEDARRLAGTLGAADRRKLDEYLHGLREIERRIELAETADRGFDPAIPKPSGVPVLFSEYLQLMFDLQVLALRADLTRVITFMIGREASLRTYGEIGVPESHHPLTHHSGDPEKVEKVTRINIFHAEQFAALLGKLDAADDGGPSLLDSSMVVYGSGISDGNKHTHENLPMVLAGRGGGLSLGQHTRYAAGTPVTNLFLTLLECMGVRPESIGDSTGELHHLTAI